MTSDTTLRVETDRFGPFTFQTACQTQEIETLLLRVQDAQNRFDASPLAQVANRLEKEVVVSSIYSTNSIEGGTLSEAETASALDVSPVQIQDHEQRRATNLKSAYEQSLSLLSQANWQPNTDYIKTIHAAITEQLPHVYNQPGLLRDNPKNIITHVSDAAHGGRYKPPQYGKDIEHLLDNLMSWHQQLVEQDVSPLIRAPLIHFYFELIHPFWDGNGRVGRVLEASILHAAGFRYAPFAQARYYYTHIDQYFALFNHGRKAAAKHADDANADFVGFFLKGMLSSLNHLHDRVNTLVAQLLYTHELKQLHDTKAINARQYAIVNHVLNQGQAVALSELRQEPWFLALYARLTDKTRQRDMKQLLEQGTLRQDENGELWPGFDHRNHK